ncbi:hypothetical protein CBW53_02870 [Yersinia frederiksenii]|nr:hypothetical protein CBW53_02870 [Yersinia frederiksenii]CNI68386.1 Uncharacterised protein [Yersinia frederiksenii]
MNELDGIIKFIQSPLGKMLTNASKDIVMNHIIPYVKNNAMRPVDMSEGEQERRAKEEFATVDAFDLKGEKVDENNGKKTG